QQTDTYFVVAHFHYVLVGGLILAIFGGIFYWFPKVTGRFLDEKLGKWFFWLYFIAFNLTFMPMHWTGLLGMPRRIFTYSAELNLETVNMLSSVGGLLHIPAGLLLVWNLARSLKR